MFPKTREEITRNVEMAFGHNNMCIYSVMKTFKHTNTSASEMSHVMSTHQLIGRFAAGDLDIYEVPWPVVVWVLTDDQQYFGAGLSGQAVVELGEMFLELCLIKHLRYFAPLQPLYRHDIGRLGKHHRSDKQWLITVTWPMLNDMLNRFEWDYIITYLFTLTPPPPPRLQSCLSHPFRSILVWFVINLSRRPLFLTGPSRSSHVFLFKCLFPV